jgi:hypothetical protein
MPADLKDNTFEVDLSTTPSIWSPCVRADGVVPDIVIKTTVTLTGTKSTDGSVVGSSDKTDTKKALTLHFMPAWQPCTA